MAGREKASEDSWPMSLMIMGSHLSFYDKTLSRNPGSELGSIFRSYFSETHLDPCCFLNPEP